VNENTNEVNYDLPNFSKPRWTLYVAGVFFVSFLLYFPISAQVQSFIKKAVGSSPACPITYTDLGFQLFMPKVIVKNVNLPASCFGNSGAPIVLDNLFLHIRGLNFSPIGPHFKVETQLFGNPLEAFVTVGLSTMAINLDNTKLNLSELSKFLPAGVKLNGDIQVEALAKAGQSGIQDLNLKASSKNLIIPSQNIMGFALTTLNIKNLLLKTQMESNNMLRLTDLIIGADNSPIRGNLKGTIRLNQRNINASPIDLIGEVAFSQEFLDKYAIIGMVMNQFDKRDDFYQIQLKGALGSPIPSSPSK